MTIIRDVPYRSSIRHGLLLKRSRSSVFDSPVAQRLVKKLGNAPTNLNAVPLTPYGKEQRLIVNVRRVLKKVVPPLARLRQTYDERLSKRRSRSSIDYVKRNFQDAGTYSFKTVLRRTAIANQSFLRARVSVKRGPSEFSKASLSLVPKPINVPNTSHRVCIRNLRSKDDLSVASSGKQVAPELSLKLGHTRPRRASIDSLSGLKSALSFGRNRATRRVVFASLFPLKGVRTQAADSGRDSKIVVNPHFDLPAALRNRSWSLASICLVRLKLWLSRVRRKREMGNRISTTLAGLLSLKRMKENLELLSGRLALLKSTCLDYANRRRRIIKDLVGQFEVAEAEFLMGFYFQTKLHKTGSQISLSSGIRDRTGWKRYRVDGQSVRAAICDLYRTKLYTRARILSAKNSGTMSGGERADPSSGLRSSWDDFLRSGYKQELELARFMNGIISKAGFQLPPQNFNLETKYANPETKDIDLETKDVQLNAKSANLQSKVRESPSMSTVSSRKSILVKPWWKPTLSDMLKLVACTNSNDEVRAFVNQKKKQSKVRFK